ncbi:hypothetical protein ALC60_04596, partial [Trachymyrmex zeteki]
GDRLSPRQTCPLPPFRSRNVRSLIGPPSAGQKVHRWTYLSMPFLHMSLGRSSFVERHRAKEEREVEEGKGEGNGARRPVCRGVSAFCERQMTVAYLPELAAILLRSELRRRPNARRKK